MNEWRDRTVIVTGAGAGIGARMAALFSESGARTIAVDNREESLDELIGHYPDVTPLCLDLTHPSAADEIINVAGGRVDTLCNNAGAIDSLGMVDETSDNDWDRLFAINVTAPFRLCRKIVPLMRQRGNGSIVNTASIAGLAGGRGGAAYTASKWALVGLTLNIAAAVSLDGLRCNAIAPGSVATDIREGVVMSEASRALYRAFRRWPEPLPPDSVAALALFLASDAAIHLNGAVIPVDSGVMAY